ncbi:uncharacterized protein LOC108194336 isoform X1 [Daucus carota subsp. sativus]|uniref:uncharacterized protein LOC108194336 isoform X1 n=1 Tax=Daucus carota subsp. sativus TaxID=79200 RepID=UPI0007EF423C|nr:PREDICTED: uncharacterized protein LOC108194336 isoform X1 [Daucus carota subsp. sativus]
MDQHPVIERDFGVDLEAGETTSDQAERADNVSAAKLERIFFNKLCKGFDSVDALEKAGNGVSLGLSNGSVTSPQEVKLLVDEKVQATVVVDFKEHKTGKEKRKTKSATKPPRPPRGLSLDAYDQKLIKEIAQLAMMKRARVERIKALKKIKAAKASSSSSGNLFAMLFTIVFFLVILFQGVPSRSSETSFPGSPESAIEDGSLLHGNYLNLSLTGTNVLRPVSPNSPARQISTSSPDNKRSKEAR